ncbi:MAG: glycosyltransferase 87 family protein [Actinomycetota bacterium]
MSGRAGPRRVGPGRFARVAEWVQRAAMHRGGLVAVAIIGTVAAMIAGFLLKAPCNPPRVWDGFQYSRNCYTDVLPLYGDRGGELKAARPFAHHGLAYRDLNLEYPALTGLFISSVNAPVPENDASKFLAANAMGLAIFGLIGAAALAAIARRPKRLVLYVAAPALVSYAFHNWDLLAVGFAAVGLWAFARDRDSLAGAMLGLGAAAKVYPGLIVPALMLARLREGRRAAPVFWNAFLWFAIPNAVVFAYAGGSAWWFPWKFQSMRLPNFETLWYFILHHGSRATQSDFWFDGGFAKTASALSLLLFVMGALLLLFFEWRRPRFRPVTTAFGLVVLFLLTAKVFSPQYAIWLLPFFVLVRVPWHAYVLFVLGDFFVLGAVWGFFNAIAHGGSQNDVLVLEIATGFRYLTLLYLLFWTRRGEDLTGDEPEPRSLPAGEPWLESPIEPQPLPEPT